MFIRPLFDSRGARTHINLRPLQMPDFEQKISRGLGGVETCKPSSRGGLALRSAELALPSEAALTAHLRGGYDDLLLAMVSQVVARR